VAAAVLQAQQCRLPHAVGRSSCECKRSCMQLVDSSAAQSVGAVGAVGCMCTQPTSAPSACACHHIAAHHDGRVSVSSGAVTQHDTTPHTQPCTRAEKLPAWPARACCAATARGWIGLVVRHNGHQFRPAQLAAGTAAAASRSGRSALGGLQLPLAAATRNQAAAHTTRYATPAQLQSAPRHDSGTTATWPGATAACPVPTRHP
jgi:hypothetical protein